ncbi:MAG: carbohydrate kinase family protein [bacterium]|nr:carbohydrate kinase family protein [bacterium]
MSKKPILLVSGSLAYDRIMNFPGRFRDHIVPQKIHLLNLSFAVPDLHEHFGGTAGNIAYSLSLLGLRSEIIGAVGRDFSDYRAWLRRHGVGISGVRLVAGDRTAAAYIITDADDNQITGFHIGAMHARGVPPSSALLARAAGAIVAPGNVTDMVALPGSYRRAQVRYWVDPGQQLTSLSGAQLRQALGGAYGLVANDYEHALVARKTGWTAAEISARVHVVVTTLGPKGSVIRQGNTRWRIPPAKPKRVADPTGAGDAYRAGLLYGWLRNWPWPAVGRLAATVAAYTVERDGTQTHRFTWREVTARYRRAFGSRVPS